MNWNKDLRIDSIDFEPVKMMRGLFGFKRSGGFISEDVEDRNWNVEW